MPHAQSSELEDLPAIGQFQSRALEEPETPPLGAEDPDDAPEALAPDMLTQPRPKTITVLPEVNEEMPPLPPSEEAAAEVPFDDSEEVSSSEDDELDEELPPLPAEVPSPAGTTSRAAAAPTLSATSSSPSSTTSSQSQSRAAAIAPISEPASSTRERPSPPSPESASAFQPAAAAGETESSGRGATAPIRPVGELENSPNRAGTLLPQRETAVISLHPDLQREIAAEIARMQENERRNPFPTPSFPEPEATDSAAITQVDISRAPSPAEARPIRAIPVPEDWVPLGRREWTPQRKYWAAAATCHLPLYFQDPMLERYGHSVENFFGPLGRYMAYPVDDHTQSTQRNQILQPWFSAGLFAFQIIAWPYNLIMDPPWEAHYDLGYYRPGDKIPTDLYYLPLHGIGPPLAGRKY